MAKRTQRKLSAEVREKISQGLKGRKHSDETKRKMSESMKKYWSTIPYENNESNTEGDAQETN